MTSKRVPLSWNGVKDLGNLCMPRSAQEKLKIRRGRGIVCADVMGNAGKCAWSMPLRACVKVCHRTCRFRS